MIRLVTPLVVFTGVAVFILSAIRLFVVPDAWVSSLVALAFLPVVIGGLYFRARNQSGDVAKVSSRLRAALVGAGVALAAALLLSITDTLELTNSTHQEGWRALLPLIPAVIGVAADLISARLEKKALDTKDD